MKYLLKQHSYSVCIFIVALAAQGPLSGSLRSTQGESKREIIPHHSRAPLSLLGTDFKDFTDHAEMHAAHLLAPCKSKKRILTPPERWEILQQLRMHMIQYKSEEDLAIDRNGNAIPPALDHRESEFLSNLIKTLTVPPLLSDRIAALPPDINRILAPLLVGDITRQFFGTHEDNTVLLPMHTIAISFNTSTIITDTGSGHSVQIHRYNNTSHDWELQHTINHADWINSAAISSDGSTVVTGSRDNTAQIHRYNNTTHRWELHHTITHTHTIQSVAISSDGSTVVTGYQNRIAQIHHYNNTTYRWELQHTINHASFIDPVAISADGLTVVTGSNDNTAQIHRYNNTTHRWELHHTIMHSDWVKSVAISSDGSTIVIAYFDRTAQIYRFNTSILCWELQLHINQTHLIDSIAISSDGSTVVTASFDRTTQIYRFNALANRWELREIINNTNQFFFVAVSSDGSNFVACTSDGTTLLYRSLTEEELQHCVAIITTHLDVTLLLQDIYTKNRYFPNSTITLTHEQHNTLLKLPLHALEILLKRAKIKFLPFTTSTNSSSAATSSGTTESQQLVQLLAKRKHPKQN